MRFGKASVWVGTILALGFAVGGAAAQDWGERRDERRDEYRERRDERREEHREERRERREESRDNWQRLGCKSVGFLGDRDVIRVGRREGRFEAIRFEVHGNDIHMMDAEVVYGNGQTDNLEIRARIPQGGGTRPIELRGRGERTISEIRLAYRSQPSFRGQAEVCAYGRD